MYFNKNRRIQITVKGSVLFSSLLCPITEHKKYNQTLHQRAVFPTLNTKTSGTLNCLILSFRFKSISFNKKRALPFFLAIELLTQRKCVASLSSRNIQAWKIRKGILVGCKVTLRREGLENFLDRLSFTFPRIEKFTPPIGFMSKLYKKDDKKATSTVILTLGELVLFYPIELSLGRHPDVKQVVLNFIFSTFSIEERYFLLRYSKIPIFNLKCACSSIG